MNGAGRLVKTESGNCVDEYGYDWMGNVIKHKRTIKGLDGKKTEYNSSYSYDYFGRMKTMKLPDGEIVTYGYNKGGQLSGVGSSKGNPYVSGIRYNLNGQRTKIEYGNGTGTSYEYDERNHRLKRLETRNAKSILQTIEYEYDATGNVTERESEMLGTDGRMKRAVHEYEYDSSGRLTEGSGKVERTTGGILRPNIVSYKSKYAYDTIGNILTKTQAVNGGESNLSCDDTYTYGGKQPHAVTKAGAMVFTYDDNGNMIKRENTETKNTMTLVWDDENRLIKTTDSFHTTDYRYDANGERIIKKSELGETQYVSANYIVRNKTVISKHVFAGNQRIASTVSMKNNCGTMTEQNTMYFHPDHLGSSSYVTDKKGNFFEMIEYLPYGETLYDEAATVDKTEFRFTSKEQDAETGLYYYGARYRDARTSRWISTDPILESYLSGKPAGGIYNPGNINLYTYCWGNPVKYIDPDGKYVESPWDIFCIGVSATMFSRDIYNLATGDPNTDGIDMTLSTLSLVYDVVSVAVPVLPGFAGPTLQASRLARMQKTAVDIAKSPVIPATINGTISAYDAYQNGGDTLNISTSFGISFGMTYFSGSFGQKTANTIRTFDTRSNVISKAFKNTTAWSPSYVEPVEKITKTGISLLSTKIFGINPLGENGIIKSNKPIKPFKKDGK